MIPIPEHEFSYDPPVTPRGPRDAKILIVGEAPGKNEIEAGKPFVGASGNELANMLNEAGIDINECRITNVVGYRPSRNNINLFFESSKKKGLANNAKLFRNKWVHDIVLAGVAELKKEILRVKPNVIIACGNVSLWATTGEWGITSWRGSQMLGSIEDHTFKVVPIIHPAGILRNWEWRWHTIVDLRRAKQEAESPEYVTPDYDFTIRPSYMQVMQWLADIKIKLEKSIVPLAVDIETRTKHIACVGLADTDRRAICIPFMCIEDDAGYWSFEEEFEIWKLLHDVLTHKNCHVIGQNFLYDDQYFIRRAGFACNLTDDTMMKMHVVFPGVRKGLDFISSVFCRWHCYWKDEGKEWHKNMDEDQLWEYNCKDAVATFEANTELDKLLDKFSLRDLYIERMNVSREVALPMMLRGFEASIQYKRQLYKDCEKAITERKEFLAHVLGGVNLFGAKGGVSPQKMKWLCYDVFQLPPKYRIDPQTKQRRLSCDKDAIAEWLQSCNIIYRPILHTIKEIRSISVFKNTFAGAPLDWDDKFRCSMNVAGPHTFRWSSSEDAFGFGANLQTIPKGDER